MAGTRRSAGTRGPDRGFDFMEVMDGVGLLAGGANVIMQLSWLPVGYGVAESTVDSGSLYRRPVKRIRTTLSYLAVAALGSDEERLQLRRQVDTAHTQVRSRPGSPVAYDAFDPQLQLWVAACIYQGFADVHRVFLGPLDSDRADRMYAAAARFASTLQVPTEMWPADRDAFARYWAEGVAKVQMDTMTRAYLYDFASLGWLPRPIPDLFGGFSRFVAAGFLPPRFREELGLPWDEHRQRAFDALMAALARVNGLLPRQVRKLPYNLLLADARRRLATGRWII